MPASLLSLPDELLASILDSSAPPFKPFDNGRTQALRLLSSLNKRVRPLVQEILRRHFHVSLPDHHERLLALPTNLAVSVKTLVVRLEPVHKDENGHAEPVEADLAELANLPNVRTLIVEVKSVSVLTPRQEGGESDEHDSYSTITIDRSGSSHLSGLESLWINNGILKVPEVDSIAPFAPARLVLCGQILVDSSGIDTELSTLLTSAALPNLRVLRLATDRPGTYDVLHAHVDAVWLPEGAPAFLDQLDLLQVEVSYTYRGFIPFIYTATSAPTLFRVSPDSPNLPDVRYLYTPQIDLLCKFKYWMMDELPHLEAVFHPREANYTDLLMITCKERGIKVIRCEESMEDNTDFVLPEFEAYIKAKRGSV